MSLKRFQNLEGFIWYGTSLERPFDALHETTFWEIKATQLSVKVKFHK